MATVKVFDKSGETFIGETQIADCKIQYGISKAADWSFSIPLTSPIVTNLSVGQFIEVWHDGSMLVKGRIQEVEADVTENFKISYKGRDYLDLLYQISPHPFAYFKNQTYLKILAELLRFTDWRLGVIDPVLDLLKQKSTVDLRGKKSLAEQLSELFKMIGNIQYRLQKQGKKVIDLGTFTSPKAIFGTQVTEGQATFPTLVINGIKLKEDVDYQLGSLSAVGPVTTTPSGKRAITMADGLLDTQVIDDTTALVEEVRSSVFSLKNRRVKGSGGTVLMRSSASINTPFTQSVDTMVVYKVLPSGKVKSLLLDTNETHPFLTYSLKNGAAYFGITFFGPINNYPTNPYPWYRSFPLHNEVIIIGMPDSYNGSGSILFNLEPYNVVLPETSAYVLRFTIFNIGTNINNYMFVRYAPDTNILTKNWTELRSTGGVVNTFTDRSPSFELEIASTNNSINLVSENQIFEEYKVAEGDTMTAQQVSEAGKALLARARSIMNNRLVGRKVYELEASASNLFIRPGDYVKFSLSQTIGSTVVNLDNESLKVESIDYDFNNGIGKLSVKLTTNPELEYTDPFIETKDRAKPQTIENRVDLGFNFTAHQEDFIISETTISLNNLHPNTFTSDNIPGTLIEYTPTNNLSRLLCTPVVSNANEPVFVERLNNTKFVAYTPNGWNYQTNCNITMFEYVRTNSVAGGN